MSFLADSSIGGGWLPDDCISIIFSFFDGRELPLYNLVNRSWYAAYRYHEELWRMFAIERWGLCPPGESYFDAYIRQHLFEMNTLTGRPRDYKMTPMRAHESHISALTILDSVLYSADAEGCLCAWSMDSLQSEPLWMRTIFEHGAVDKILVWTNPPVDWISADPTELENFESIREDSTLLTSKEFTVLILCSRQEERVVAFPVVGPAGELATLPTFDSHVEFADRDPVLSITYDLLAVADSQNRLRTLTCSACQSHITEFASPVVGVFTRAADEKRYYSQEGNRLQHRIIWTVEEDGTMKAWDLDEVVLKPMFTLSTNIPGISLIRYDSSSDHAFILGGIARHYHTTIVAVDMNRRIFRSIQTNSDASCMEISDGHVYCGLKSGLVVRYNIRLENPLEYSGCSKCLNVLRLSDRLLVGGSEDRSLHVWNRSTGKHLYVLLGGSLRRALVRDLFAFLYLCMCIVVVVLSLSLLSWIISGLVSTLLCRYIHLGTKPEHPQRNGCSFAELTDFRFIGAYANVLRVYAFDS